MRSKLGTGVLIAVGAFLLATNPVVVNAASQITSAQIKNETVKSKDIKNGQLRSADVKDGSLQAGDLSPGAVPVEVKALKRFAGPDNVVLPFTIEPGFFGPTAQIQVDADDVVVASAFALVRALAGGNDYSYGLCSRPVGSSAAPSPLGGAGVLFEDVDMVAGENVASTDAAAVLGAGHHTVGWCGRAIDGTITLLSVTGWVQVLGGSTGGL